MSAQVSVVIASPLERELVERIRAAEPERISVTHEPELLPVPRYEGDHVGQRPDLDEQALDRWRSIVAGADVLFDFDWLDAAAMPRSAPRLRWVQATSAGIGEFLASTGLARSGIEFTTAAGVHGTALAEFVTLGLLYFTKRFPDLTARQREHRWERYTADRLAGRHVLLVGLGHVGRAVARQLGGLGVDVIGMARTQPAELPEGVAHLVTREALIETLRGMDGLVLACPYTPMTHHMIGPAELAALPDGAIIVNVARGSVIDESALLDTLRTGRLRGAALDVFEREPLPAGSPLWDRPDVLVSPHSASTVKGENELIVELFVDNMRRFLDGRPLRNRYDPERGY